MGIGQLIGGDTREPGCKVFLQNMKNMDYHYDDVKAPAAML